MYVSRYDVRYVCRWSVPVLGRGLYHSITLGTRKSKTLVANNKVVPVPDALIPDLGSCDVGDRR